MSASIKDPRVTDFEKLIAEVDEWRATGWAEKSAAAPALSEKVLQFMNDSGLDAPLEFRVHEAVTGGAETAAFVKGSRECDEAIARGVAMTMMLFGRLAFKDAEIRGVIVDDFLRVSAGEEPQIGVNIARANRQQDMPSMLDRLKAVAVAKAWWHGNYNGVAWERAFEALFPGAYSGDSLKRVKASLPTSQRKAIEAAAKAARAHDDAVAAGTDAPQLDPDTIAIREEVARHQMEKVRKALAAARANGWKESRQVRKLIAAAGC